MLANNYICNKGVGGLNTLCLCTTTASNEVIFIGFIPEFGFDFLEN